jgi:8-oxo-dGTP diphosphatase
MKAAGKTPVPVLAAGGIVMRDAPEPLVAIVRLRKSKAWVLPKGKLKPGEDAIAAARREVKEETGHDVSVHEFLGSMANSTGNRHKIVQFWRMQAVGGQVSELMSDVKAVKWLPLPQAIDALTHAHERVFLEHVGPVALAAAADSKHDVRGSSAERLIGEEVAHPVRRTLIDLIRAWLRRLPWTVSARTP